MRHPGGYQCEMSSVLVGLLLTVATLKMTNAAGLRLVGGSTPNEGRLEIFLDGEWGRVCGSLWTVKEAQVACRQLGFPGFIGVTQSELYGSGTGPFLLRNVMCTGSEDNLESCFDDFSSDSSSTDFCSDEEDAGIVCKPAGLRLVGGSTPNEGRLEIFLDGEWGRVCGSLWTVKEAQVACRQLGFPGFIGVTQSELYGSGTGPFLLRFIVCTGSEDNLESCQDDFSYDSSSTDFCSDEEDAAIICKPDAYCELPSDPNDVLLVKSAEQIVYHHGDSVEYNCPGGYLLRGSATRFCGSDFTWSDQPAECISEDKKAVPVMAIAGGTGGLLFVIFAVVVGSILIMRRKNQSSQTRTITSIETPPEDVPAYADLAVIYQQSIGGASAQQANEPMTDPKMSSHHPPTLPPPRKMTEDCQGYIPMKATKVPIEQQCTWLPRYT